MAYHNSHNETLLYRHHVLLCDDTAHPLPHHIPSRRFSPLADHSHPYPFYPDIYNRNRSSTSPGVCGHETNNVLYCLILNRNVCISSWLGPDVYFAGVAAAHQNCQKILSKGIDWGQVWCLLQQLALHVHYTSFSYLKKTDRIHPYSFQVALHLSQWPLFLCHFCYNRRTRWLRNRNINRETCHRCCSCCQRCPFQTVVRCPHELE